MKQEMGNIFPSSEEMAQLPIVILDSKEKLLPSVREKLEALDYQVEKFSKGRSDRTGGEIDG